MAGGVRARPPMPANGLAFGPKLVPIPCLTSNLGPGRAAGPTDRAALQNEGARNGVFGRKGGPPDTPCNRQRRPKGVEKRDLLHQMGSDPVRFSIDPVLVRNIVAATPGAGRAPANGGRFSKNDPPHHVQEGSVLDPRFRPKGCARDPPPIPADGLPYGPTRVPIPCLASNLWSGTRGESNGLCGATKRRATKRRFRPKRGFAQHPMQPAMPAEGGRKARSFAPNGLGPRLFQH